jgi:hypothetical protein
MAKRAPPKWKAKFEECITAMTNRELLDAVYEAAMENGYDGGFSTRMQVEYDLLRKELERRLDFWLQLGDSQ